MPAKKAAKKVSKKVPAKKAAAKKVTSTKKAAKKTAVKKVAKKAPAPKDLKLTSLEEIRYAAYLNSCARIAAGHAPDEIGDWLAAERALGD